jgi:hypothetical protein
VAVLANPSKTGTAATKPKASSSPSGVQAVAPADPLPGWAWATVTAPGLRTYRGSRTLQFHCLVEDNTRVSQKATAWMDLPLRASALGGTGGYSTVGNIDRSSPGVCAAVGRAQRSKDAEKLCIVHAVLLLAQHGVAMHDSADAYDDFVSVALGSTGVVVPHSFGRLIDPAGALAVRAFERGSSPPNCETCLPLVSATLRRNARLDVQRSERAERSTLSAAVKAGYARR